MATLARNVGKAAQAYPRRWLAAIAMMVALLMDMVDITIVNVALPTVRRSLNASGTQLEWVISAYLLAFAVTLITAGSVGDIFGRKRVFLIGIGGFGLASLAAALAQDSNQLIAARVFQGASAAAMLPQLLATFREIFEGKERGQAFALYGVIIGLASGAGLLLGGALTDANLFGWSWRSVFVVNVPVALFTLVAAALVVPETRNPSAGRPDFAGFVLLTTALVGIVYPLLEGRQLGWPVWLWLMLAGGLVLLAGLGWFQSRRAQTTRIAPLLRTELFRIPAFSAGMAVQFAFAAGLQGFFLIFALWLQLGQHYSPMRAGLTTLAFSVGGFALAGPSISLARRFGRLVLVTGGILMSVGVLGVGIAAAQVDGSDNPWLLLPGLVAAGAGLSMLIIPVANVVLAAVPGHAAGAASGIFTTTQQLSGAIGVALIGTVFFDYLSEHTFTQAFTHSVPFLALSFLAASALSVLLPRKAVLGEFENEDSGYETEAA